MAAAAILKKSNNRNISAAVKVISTKFGTVMQFDPLERSDRSFVIAGRGPAYSGPQR